MATETQPPTKRMRVAYHHHHKMQHGLQALPSHQIVSLPGTAVDKLLVDSIKIICEEQAIKQGITEPLIESVALEALRSASEEFALRFCSKVSRSMFAARRTAPIATDFNTAVHALSLARPDDELKPYQSNPPTNPQMLPTPPPENAFHNHVELTSSFLGPELSKQNDLKKLTFNLRGLPPLPSAHTYKDSEVFGERETDSRRIRELATEEGKLGEQALRKLAGAVKLDTALSTEPELRTIRAGRGPRRKQPVLSEEAVFEETMRDLLKSESGKFELGPIVTSERAYRMPDEARVKRRPAATARGNADQTSSVGASSKYNVLPPPRKETPRVERMDMS